MWVDGLGHLPGQLVVVSGPSGCGKSSVIRSALEGGGLNARLSVSATTRAPRPGELEGVDYEFMSVDAFLAYRDEGRFLEWAEYNGNSYGTPKKTVYETLATGKSVILEIEVHGALLVREQSPTALFVFIKTPTFRVLEERLRHRGTETEAVILRRLRTARKELAEAHWYDHQIVNDDFDACVEQFTRLLSDSGCGG